MRANIRSAVGGRTRTFIGRRLPKIGALAAAVTLIAALPAAADTGVTKTDRDVWREHLVGDDPRSSEGRLVVLNKIDGLWDELKTGSAVIYNAFVGAKVGSSLALAVPGQQSAASASPSPAVYTRVIEGRPALC